MQIDSDSRPPGIQQNRIGERLARDWAKYNAGMARFSTPKRPFFKASANWESRHILFSHYRQHTTKFALLAFPKRNQGAAMSWRPAIIMVLQVQHALSASSVFPLLLDHPVIVSESNVELGSRSFAGSRANTGRSTR